MSELKDFYSVVAGTADRLDPAPPERVRWRGTRRRRVRQGLVSGFAAVAVVAAVGTVTVATHQPAKPSPAATAAPSTSPAASPAFAPLRQVGAGLAFGAAGRSGAAATAVSGDHGYAVWRTASPNEFTVGAIDLRTGEQLWASQAIQAAGDNVSIAVVGDVVMAEVGESTGSSPQEHTFGLDAATGAPLWQLPAAPIITEAALVVALAGKITGYNPRSGKEIWRKVASWFEVIPMDSAADRHFSAGEPVRVDSRFGVVSPDGRWQLFDGTTGSAIGRPTHIGLDYQTKLASGGTLYLGGYNAAAHAYTIKAVRDGSVVPIRTGTGTILNYYLTTCWPQRICLVEVRAANVGELVLLDDSSGREVWRSPLTVLGLMGLRGDLIAVTQPGHDSAGAKLALFDGAGRPLHTETLPLGQVDVLTSGRDAVILPGSGHTTAERTTVRGINAGDGSLVELGAITAVTSACTATSTRLFCIGESGVIVWKLRAD